MERNIDRNLRMAKREARRFFGIRSGLGRDGIYVIALLLAFGGYYLVEPHVKHFPLFHEGLGWFLIAGMIVALAAISFVLKRFFGIHFWGRPRHEFYRGKRAGDAPRQVGWRHRKHPRNVAKNGSRSRKP